jgi:hypothetical protein
VIRQSLELRMLLTVSLAMIPVPVPGTQGRPHQCPPSSGLLPSARSLCTALWHTQSAISWRTTWKHYLQLQLTAGGTRGGERRESSGQGQVPTGQERPQGLKSAPTGDEGRLRWRQDLLSGGGDGWRRMLNSLRAFFKLRVSHHIICYTRVNEWATDIDRKECEASYLWKTKTKMDEL